MLHYVRHEEEFYCIIKLCSGVDLVSKAMVVFDDEIKESVVFLTDPVEIATFTKSVDEDKAVKGMGFSKWMQFSDEDFFYFERKGHPYDGRVESRNADDVSTLRQW